MGPIAVSLGDPSGIGPDIAIAAWLQRDEVPLPAFFVVGDPAVLQSRARHLGVELSVGSLALTEAGSYRGAALPVVPTEPRMVDAPGKSVAANAEAVIQAIDLGVEATLSGLADALVTLPITKEALYDAGFAFPGHTEYLGHLARLRGHAATPVMMLAGPELRTVPVTIHIALAKVPGLLTTSAIVETGRVVARDLQARFGIPAPRLAIAGLHPHAGEGGAMGREDVEIVAPAVTALVAGGIDARGPLPADTLFHPRARHGYDAALCMYHDQALIPAKTLAFDDAVNVTLGLPFIRTSPDHGTAYDIAGTGQARPDSFIAALRMAREMADRSGAARP